MNIVTNNRHYAASFFRHTKIQERHSEASGSLTLSCIFDEAHKKPRDFPRPFSSPLFPSYSCSYSIRPRNKIWIDLFMAVGTSHCHF